MFLEKIKLELIDVFLESIERTPVAQSAVNVALYKVLKSPSLGKAFDHIQLHQSGPEFIELAIVSSNGKLNKLNVLEEVYDDGSHYDWEDMTEQQEFALSEKLESLPTKPDVFEYGKSPFDINSEVKVSAEVEQLSLYYVEMLLERVQLAEEVFLSQTLLPNDVSFSWLNDQEMQDYLSANYLSPINTKVHLNSYGIDYFSLNYSSGQEKVSYFLAETKFGPIGVLTLTHHEEDHCMHISSLSVSQGYRNQGISKKLFEGAVNLAVEKNAYVVRTSPGNFSKENPGITSGYDKLANNINWPVIKAGSGGLQFLLKEIIKENSDVRSWKDAFLKEYPNASPPLERIYPVDKIVKSILQPALVPNNTRSPAP